MTENRNNDRGQVGVGTLIVFIAMVLVAAIASGVLINAAGLLQTKSAQASEESSDQVSNRIQVVNAIGQVNTTSDDALTAVNITVSLSPSADEVDLSQATMQWTGPSGTFTATHNSSGDGDGDFFVSVVKDDDTSKPVMNARDDRLKLDIDTKALTGSELSAGSSVTIRFTTQSGATTIIQLEVPQSVAGETAVQL